MSFNRKATLIAVSVSFSLITPIARAQDKKEGVPHIVIFNDAGSIGLEFNVVDPVIINGIPTITVFTSVFNALAGEYTSAPLSGLDSGFINDDMAFESEMPFIGSNIVVTLTSIQTESADFFIALGAGFVFNPGQSFTLGSAFDSHPTYGLLSSDPNFTGNASLIFEIHDTNNILAGSSTLGVIISADPEDAIGVNQLCSIADLNNDTILDFFDVSLFLSAFTSQLPAADFTQDGIYNFFDVSAFLSAFALGCP